MNEVLIKEQKKTNGFLMIDNNFLREWVKVIGIRTCHVITDERGQVLNYQFSSSFSTFLIILLIVV